MLSVEGGGGLASAIDKLNSDSQITKDEENADVSWRGLPIHN